MDLIALRRRIDFLRTQQLEPKKWRRENIEALILAVARAISAPLDLVGADKDLVREREIDKAALVRAFGRFRDLDGSYFVQPLPPQANGEIPDPRKIATDAWSAAQTLNPNDLPPLEIALRIEYGLEPSLQLLLRAVGPAVEITTWLQCEVEKKLHLLSPEQLRDVWARAAANVDRSQELYLPTAPEIIPDDFFVTLDWSEVVEKLARYLVEIRPALLTSAWKQGVHYVPLTPLAIAQALSWTTASPTVRPSPDRLATLRNVSRLAVCCEQYLHWTRLKLSELAGGLGVPIDGALIGKGARSENAEKKLELSDDVVLDVLAQLSDDAIAVSNERRPLLDDLRAFKLGMELCSDEELARLPTVHERELQRLLMRFLVERHHAVVGTIFGRSQTDLRVDDAFGTVVIEAKRLQELPSDSDLNKWLSQLGGYMDQAPIRNLGVLGLFNFTNTGIYIPEARFGAEGRYYVTAVNLCPDPPSKRDDSMEILRAPGVDLKNLVSTRRPLPVRRAGRRKNKSRKTNIRPGVDED